MDITGSAAVSTGLVPDLPKEISDKDIPDQFDIVIRSFHEGPLRKYVCALTPALSRQPAALRGRAIASDSIEGALAAALAQPLPALDSRFWSGVGAALPLSLLLWGIAIGIGFAVWNF